MNNIKINYMSYVGTEDKLDILFPYGGKDATDGRLHVIGATVNCFYGLCSYDEQMNMLAKDYLALLLAQEGLNVPVFIIIEHKLDTDVSNLKLNLDSIGISNELPVSGKFDNFGEDTFNSIREHVNYNSNEASTLRDIGLATHTPKVQDDANSVVDLLVRYLSNSDYPNRELRRIDSLRKFDSYNLEDWMKLPRGDQAVIYTDLMSMV